MLKAVAAAAAAAVLSFAVAPAMAQQWPTGPVTMIIPFAAGGPTDVLGRIVAERISKSLGAQVVIENVGGAGGMTGSSRVAKATPNGNVFGIGTVGTHAQGQTLYAKPAYDAVNDFEHVILVAQVPIALIAKNGLPPTDLKSFIAHAKANPGKLNFASAGTGSAVHLACVLFNSAAGIKAAHVPYKGTGPAMNDLVGGQVDYMCEIMSTAKSQIEGKRVKALALFNLQRSPALSGLPTADEQGQKGFEAYTWNAIFMPKGTPAAIVSRLNAVTREAMDDPAVAKRLTDLGAVIVPNDRRTPQFLRGFVKSEIEKWAKPIKESGAKAG
jgi:tripartite-type tricarboxylate transporter receptor subunit TctC